LHGQAVLIGLPDVAAKDVRDPTFRAAQQLRNVDGVLEKTLRCRFMLFGIAVHSYDAKVVNLPGFGSPNAGRVISITTAPRASPAFRLDFSVAPGQPGVPLI
jgi:hypothetical protein